MVYALLKTPQDSVVPPTRLKYLEEQDLDFAKEKVRSKFVNLDDILTDYMNYKSRYVVVWDNGCLLIEHYIDTSVYIHPL